MDDHSPAGRPTARPRLLDRVRDAIARRHYSRRTEETYVHWIKRFIHFHGTRHPRELGETEVTAFLNHLARDRDVAASTQNQALSALLFLYKEALNQPLAWLDGLERAKRPARLPTVLSVDEVRRLLAQIDGARWLMASLLYGAGLRLRECLKLRVKDVDFDYRQILVRDGKGGKDRVTMLPESVIEPLKAHLVRVKALHDKDLADGFGDVELPDALSRKYPRAPYEWGWKFVFPSHKLSADPRTGAIRCHHVYENYLIRAVKRATRAAGIAKHVSCHNPAPLLCHPPASLGLRHQDGAGVARTFRREHDHDLHARDEQGRARGDEPARPAGAAARRVPDSSRGVKARMTGGPMRKNHPAQKHARDERRESVRSIPRSLTRREFRVRVRRC